MGYVVKSYEFSELSRVSLEGKIAPSLFWVLPIGRWDPEDLKMLWRRFTSGHGPCHDLGYVLVKNAPDRSHRTSGKADFSFVSAGLGEVLPTTVQNWRIGARPWRNLDGAASALILAGSYPQPGWGLLIRCPKESFTDMWANSIEECIGEVLDQINRGGASGITALFAEVGDSFWKYESCRSRLDCFDEGRLGILLATEEKWKALLALIHATELALAKRDVRQMESSAGKFCNQLSGREFLKGATDLEDVSKEINQARSKVRWAYTIAIARPEEFQPLEHHVREVLSDSGSKGRRMAELAGNQRKLFNAWVESIVAGLAPSGGSIQELKDWASTNLDGYLCSVGAAIGNARGLLEKRIGENKTAEVRLRSDREADEKNFPRSFARYQEVSGRATELQNRLSPSFLIDLESALRGRGIEVLPIPWDPARMVGWKAFSGSNESRISLEDLQDAARELNAPPPDSHPAFGPDGPPGEIFVDGGFFTDYVHHVATTVRGLSPWEASAALLAKIFRPTELARLIRELRTTGQEPPARSQVEGTRLEMAEELIGLMGWKREERRPREPLRSLITHEPGRPIGLMPGKSVNDLRISLESYCKDLLDVIVSKLQGTGRDLSRLINAGLPGYRWANRDGCWAAEVDGITVGGARMLVGYLGKQAFPENRHQLVNDISEIIGWLGSRANILSHDQRDAMRESGTPIPTPGELAPRVIRLLELTEGLIGEMPWHLEVACSMGNCPMVLSGEAWCHGASAKKSLKVICWEKPPRAGSEVTFWNPSRRNPVITDPTFLRRPD